MNKQEARQELEQLEKRKAELQAIINTPELTPEQLFRSLVDGLSVCIVDSGNVIFYNKKNEWVLEIGNSKVWFQYDRFWVKFYNAFSWDYNQTQSFLKSQLEKHFKMSGVTPVNVPATHLCLLEKHFKMSGVTPGVGVLRMADSLEKHFKMKGTQR